MKFLVAVLLTYCFAEELEPLQDSYSSNTSITCSAITPALYGSADAAEVACDRLPGCGWKGNTFDVCVVDDCWKYDQTGSINTPPTSTNFLCQCSTTGLSTRPTSCTGTWDPGYPAQASGNGAGEDFYCQKTWSVGQKQVLDQCSLRYLRNGTCTAPFCILQDYDPDHPEVGKHCVQVPECKVFKSTDNILRLNTQNLCSCLEARRAAGETTACNQNPNCYVANSGTYKGQCIADTCYALAVDQDAPSCATATAPPDTTCVQATVLSDLGGGAQGSKTVCVASNGNTSPNPCWGLHNVTSFTQPGSSCPVNPYPNPESSSGYNFKDNVSGCTGNCTVADISTYYYGATKICVDAEHAPDGGKILNIPSVLAFLVMVLVSILV